MPCHHSLSLCCSDLNNDLAVQATFSVTSCYSVNLNFCKLLKHRFEPLCLGCGKTFKQLDKLSSCCILVGSLFWLFPSSPTSGVQRWSSTSQHWTSGHYSLHWTLLHLCPSIPGFWKLDWTSEHFLDYWSLNSISLSLLKLELFLSLLHCEALHSWHWKVDCVQVSSTFTNISRLEHFFTSLHS